MATLYVENVPDELYEALRGLARQHRKSIAAEVLTLLEENVPTATGTQIASGIPSPVAASALPHPTISRPLPFDGRDAA